MLIGFSTHGVVHMVAKHGMAKEKLCLVDLMSPPLENQTDDVCSLNKGVSDISSCVTLCTSWQLSRVYGRFPFDQKFRKFRVWERMEQTFSGISFRNFGCTSRGWPKIPENRNNRKIPFHSTIPARAQFRRARKSNSTWLPILLLNISVPLVIMRQMTWMFFCTTFAPEPRQTFVSSAKMHISYAQCLKLMW